MHSICNQKRMCNTYDDYLIYAMFLLHARCCCCSCTCSCYCQYPSVFSICCWPMEKGHGRKLTRMISMSQLQQKTTATRRTTNKKKQTTTPKESSYDDEEVPEHLYNSRLHCDDYAREVFSLFFFVCLYLPLSLCLCLRADIIQ